MLIVHDPKHPHMASTTSQDKTSYPDGITPPMRAARLKRFRKRMNKKTIEDVEREVERLLQADLEAEDVKFGILLVSKRARTILTPFGYKKLRIGTWTCTGTRQRT